MKRPIVRICIAFCFGVALVTYVKISPSFFYALALACLLFALILFKHNQIGTRFGRALSSLRTALFTKGLGRIGIPLPIWSRLLPKGQGAVGISTKGGLLVTSLKFRYDRIFGVFILVMSFCLGAIRLIGFQVVPSNHIAKFTPYKSRYVYIKGIVDSDPLIKEDRTTFILKSEDVLFYGKLHKACGEVLVNAYGRSDFSYGQRLIINGKLYRPFNFEISERLNYRDYLRRKGIYSLLSVKKEDTVKYLGENLGNPIKRFAYRMKQSMKEVISANLNDTSASMLNAMILGERKGVPKFINDLLARSGTIHILAVSGLHVGIVCFIIMVFLKVIRLPRKGRIITTIILLMLYAVLTGARPSVIRATTMILILLFGYLIHREPDIYNSLSLACLIILGVNPNELFDIGFQLSFISVVSIVWLSPKIKSLFPSRLFKKTWVRFIILGFSVSSSAWLGTIGLVAYYFRIITPVAVLANMIIVPFMLIIIAVGFTFIIAGNFSLFLASIFAPICELLLMFLFRINLTLVSIPGAYFYLPVVPAYLIVVYYVAIFMIFKYLRVFRGVSYSY